MAKGGSGAGGGGKGGGSNEKGSGGSNPSLSAEENATAQKAADIAKNNPDAKRALKSRIENMKANLDRAKRQMKQGLKGTSDYEKASNIVEKLEKQLPVLKEALSLSNK